MIMTQKEIYQALLNGETLINDLTQEKIHLSDEWLVNEKGEHTAESFLYIDNWEIYKDPKDDPKQWIGKLCLFWDEDAPDGWKVIGFLGNYMDDRESPFYETTGNNWMYCRPATREEVEQYLVKEN